MKGEKKPVVLWCSSVMVKYCPVIKVRSAEAEVPYEVSEYCTVNFQLKLKSRTR